MIDYDGLWRELAATPLASWQAALLPLVQQKLTPDSHGDLPDWYAALSQLPAVMPSVIDLNADCLSIGGVGDIDAATRDRLEQLLMQFHPWRKGPFDLFGIHIDTEWRSDWKWNRIAPHLDLRGRRVLDVGCGNGYYGWRMAGAGAALVLGVDPTLRYVMQYAALRHFIGPSANHVLPLTLEALPDNSAAFDTVFSMGVLYHRRDHVEHLQRLLGQLRDGGQLILEGLVIDGGIGAVLHPQGRYAKMKNVFALPSCATLVQWLHDSGFHAVELLDVGPTTTAEQRRTPWMQFESLADFLDPDDARRTIEGHPAPLRAVFSAVR